ncbi:LOW QUALITY PROTEIN: zwei Ig domain protein zig-8-like [Palaemon carinicauda]|uniref:LOW QUALITY PROTEIN: zwei Ig domain protein zig-8-like n=1 Tax=Palaemon carinicauda TaxID=392227 RepID=UPI0035B5CDAC
MRINAMLHSTNRWMSLLLFHLVYYSFITDAGLSRSSGPQFGSTEESVTVKEGETARLPCRVLHLKDRKVTWLRRRDLHILTTDQHTYSADERFQIVHEEGTDLWTLVVQYAQLRDAGIYECQVNADPKISRPVTLKPSQTSSMRNNKVFIANNTASTKDGDLRVHIKGAREIFMEEGSSLTLTCLVTSLYGPATLIYWYHDTQLMDYNSPRGGIKMQMDHERGETTSRLTVRNVRTEDSGMYSCVPSGSHPATVRVHIHEGENKAAVQQGGLDETSSSSAVSPASLLFVLVCVYTSTKPLHSPTF